MDGTTLIKDKKGILCRWKEHFNDLLNRYSHVEADSFDNVPSVPVREVLDDVIHIEEVRKAVNPLALREMFCQVSGSSGF